MITPIWLRLAPYLAAAAALLAALWFAYDWAFDRGVTAERARWEASVTEAGQRFAEALADQQATITQLDRELAAARRQANRRREDLADVLANDEAARDWSQHPVPDGVRRALGHRRDLPTDP